MTIEQAIALVDRVISDRTGKPLNDLQATILREVWQGKKYLEIADLYGCTEGHAKDAGYLLWKILSKAWGEKITKSNLKTVVKKRLKSIKYQIKSIAVKTPEAKTKKPENLNFLGREEAINSLNNLVNQGNKIIVIQGQGGVGKTTLAKKYLATQNFDFRIEFLMAKETANITSVETLVEEWLKRDFQEEPGKEFGVTLARLKRHLEKSKVGILIDNLEPALNKNGLLVSEQKNYIELLRILADINVKSTTLITSRDRLCESDISLSHYRLSGLSLAAWLKFFIANGIKVKASILNKMHFTYGGNAKAMGILSGLIKEDYAADTNSYWQENRNNPLIEVSLKNLVSNQFNRLQKIDPQAYSLLCRLGCYRYQDIPTVSQAGLLCLLWDIESINKKQVIKYLQNRSLLEYNQGAYWLHPVIKAEAISRLSEKEWRDTNRAIAQFYTESVSQINTIQDGLTALEAYYHYLTIADFDSAGKVILYSRLNKWGQHLTLGTTLYRLGLSQPLLKAIEQVIDKIEETKIASELNNILGDLYWINGLIKKAIACQKTTITTASNYLAETNTTPDHKQNTYYWKMLKVDSLLSIGLYNIDLWQLKEAAIFFQKAIDISQNTKHHSWSEKADICLALVDSYLGNTETATPTIQRFLQLINNDRNKKYNTGRFAYFLQILGQTLINLKQYKSAQEILQKAIAFSQESHYIQSLAKSIISLAIIARKQNNLTTAIEYHLQSISFLENIGAKCDLAESYYQYAVSLQQANNLDSQKFQEKAIQLYRQIEAPQQIKKVKENLS